MARGKNRRAHGEGTVRERGDGRWEGRLSVGGGKSKSYYGNSRAEVVKQLTTARHLLQEGRLRTEPSQTTGKYLDGWLEDHVKGSKAPRTVESYELNIRRIKPYIGSTKLDQLKPADLQRGYGKLLAQGLSKRSVQQAHTVLHTALKQAMKLDLIDRNPADAATPPRPARQEMLTFTPEQVKHLFEATHDDRLHALWVILVTRGLRIGEALGLQWHDIDLDRKTVTVVRQLQRQRGKGLVLADVKTRESRRSIQLTSVNVSTLIRHRVRQKAEFLELGLMWHEGVQIFTSKTGQGLDSGNVYESFHRRLKGADLPVIRVHDLRHTCATQLVERGTPLKSVQALLGHATMSMTADLYGHVTPALHEHATRVTEELYGVS